VTLTPSVSQSESETDCDCETESEIEFGCHPSLTIITLTCSPSIKRLVIKMRGDKCC